MQRRSVLLGGCAFLVTHLVLVTTWLTWFIDGHPYEPWFMNSRKAVVFTCTVFAVVNAIDAFMVANRVDESIVAAGYVTVGAIAIMILVLFAQATGPGNLFPIAIVIGAFALAASSVFGRIAGWSVRTGVTRLSA